MILRPMPRLILLTATLAIARLGAAEPALDLNLQFFRDLAETRSYSLGQPVGAQLTADGKTVFFLRGGPRDPVLRLYEFDVATGAERELLTPAQLLGSTEEELSTEEKARRERARLSLKGFTKFDLSEDGRRLLVTLSGRLYVVNRDDLAVTALAPELHARLVQQAPSGHEPAGFQEPVPDRCSFLDGKAPALSPASP